MAARLQVIQYDITRLHVDAIVNAANNSLSGGDGINGAIHRAAGPHLLEETRLLGGCPTGQAKITRGYRLRCRYVIHTVGPVWQNGLSGEEESLSSCYRTSLELAAEYKCRTVAFPDIASVDPRFPFEKAVDIAIGEVMYFLDLNPLPQTVFLICADKEALAAYARTIQSNQIMNHNYNITITSPNKLIDQLSETTGSGSL